MNCEDCVNSDFEIGISYDDIIDYERWVCILGLNPVTCAQFEEEK